MKFNILKGTILMMTSIFFSGCGNAPDTDVTSAPEYNFAPFVGTTWRTKVKIAVAELNNYSGPVRTYLLTPNSFDPTHPKYTPPPGMGPTLVLPVGTLLRIERLMKDNGNWGGVLVTATLDDGTYSQQPVHLTSFFLAENRFLDPKESPSKSWDANPEMLERVAPAREK